MNMRKLIRDVPLVGRVARKVYWTLRPQRKFTDSAAYWENRYRGGGNSGVGSYDKFAAFKAEVLNAFIVENNIQSVIEFGSGDGAQLELANYPSYLGVDVSETAISICQDKFAGDPSKTFKTVGAYDGDVAELSMSLDVIYHLVEDSVFDEYMQKLFAASSRYVAVYSSNTDENVGYEGTHVKHRMFSRWVEQNAPEFRLMTTIPNRFPYQGDYRTGSFADFYFYERMSVAPAS